MARRKRYCEFPDEQLNLPCSKVSIRFLIGLCWITNSCRTFYAQKHCWLTAISSTRNMDKNWKVRFYFNAAFTCGWIYIICEWICFLNSCPLNRVSMQEGWGGCMELKLDCVKTCICKKYNNAWLGIQKTIDQITMDQPTLRYSNQLLPKLMLPTCSWWTGPQMNWCMFKNS